MKKKNKVILLSVGILLVLSLIIGFTYAFYMFSVSQEGTNTFSSDCFRIEYTDSNAISLEDAFPISESEASDLVPYTFTVSNVCNSSIDYKINIEELNTSNLDINSIRFKLDNHFSQILGSIDNNDPATFVNQNVLLSKTIFNGSLMGNSSRTFNLKLWVDENSTVEQSANKTFESKVVVTTTLNSAYKEAELAGGSTVNIKIKKLVNPDVNEATTYDETIVGFERSLTPPPEGVNKTDIALSTSRYPVYAWLDSDTNIVYYYSEASKIFYNRGSNTLFYRMSAIKNIDASGFDSSKVVNAQTMFALNAELEHLNLGDNFDTSNVTNMTYMFFNNPKLVELDLGDKFNTSNVTMMKGIFSGLNALVSLDLGSYFDTSNVTTMENMFSNLRTVTTLDLGNNFDTSKVTNMANMFNGNLKIETLNLGNKFDTSNVTSISHIFSSLNKLTELNLGDKFDTSNVTDMSSAFYGLNSISYLDLGDKFDTSKVTNMSFMFRYCSASDIFLGNKFNTENVEDMQYMFAGSYKITALNLASFDTSKVTNMSYMFSNMTNLTTIYVSDKWDNSSVTSSESMFSSCNKLVGQNGTSYNFRNVDATYAVIDREGQPGYFSEITNT